MRAPTSHFYDSQRLKLHYVKWGAPGGRPLLLVHGGFDHARSWDWVADALGDGYHIVAPDLRGHGDSAWAVGSSYPMADSIYDIKRLFAHLGWESAAMIAHSLGGAISMQFAGAFPEMVERMVVVEGWSSRFHKFFLGQGPTIEDRIHTWVDTLDALGSRHPRRYPSIETAVARMREANPRLTQDQAVHLTTHGIKQNADGTYTWKYDNAVRTIAPYRIELSDLQKLWARITCRTLLVSGSDGFPAATAEVVKFVPHAHAVTVAGAGHWVHHDKLDEFVSLTRNFLAIS